MPRPCWQRSHGEPRCGESGVDSEVHNKIQSSTSTDSISTAATVHDSHTALFLDWNDTLCPTTWLTKDCGVDWMLPLSQSLRPGARRDRILSLMDAHTMRLKEFLVEASKLGTIIIVTLAEKPSVEIAIQNLMPALVETMRDCKVEVIYALDFASDDIAKCMEEPQAEEIMTLVKTRAMIERLQEASEHFTNFVSIGDSVYEIGGILQARKYLVKSGFRDAQQCRTSSLKLLDEPNAEELIAELDMLRAWLPHLAHRIADFHGEIESPDDEALQELNLQITGNMDFTLSWDGLLMDAKDP